MNLWATGSEGLTPRQRGGLLAVVAAYLVAASMFLLRVPIGNAPDEGAHFGYVEHLANYHNFPQFKGRSEGNYEAHQPPLYYVLCVPLYCFGRPFGKAATAYLLRAVSWLCGLVCVLATFALARRLFPKDPPVALAAAAFNALLPMHLYVAAAVGNDALAGALSSLALIGLLSFTSGVPAFGAAIGLGAVMGLALLAKTSNLFLLPLSAFALILSALRHRTAWPSLLGRWVIAVGVCGLLFSGWALRNQHLYGDPLAYRAFVEGFASSPHPSYFLEKVGMSLSLYVLFVAQVTFLTFWGLLGQVNEAMVRMGQLLADPGASATVRFFALRNLCLLVSIAAFAGFVATLVKGRRLKDADPRCGHLLIAAGLGLVLLSFVNFNVTFFQAQSRYFHPMVSGLSVAAVSGLALIRAPRRWIVVAGVFGLMALLCVLDLTVWVGPP